jgi:hypothetical protein
MISPSIPQIYWLSIAAQKIICGINGLIVNVKRHTAIHYVISIYKIGQNLFVNKNCLCVWLRFSKHILNCACNMVHPQQVSLCFFLFCFHSLI